MSFSLEELNFFFCILVRISAFLFVAPIFNIKDVPVRVKIGLSITLAIILFESLSYKEIIANGVIDYALLVGKEAIAGIILGFFANVGFYILSFAGHMLDMEIGFSMVNEFDPITSTQVTITSNLYSYSVMLVMLITNMHHHILKAIVDSFQVIPVGDVIVRPTIYQVMYQFIIDYFIIGFRIILPMFVSILIVNTVLAILAKVAPQMNMFVIGIQLKVFIGLIILIFMITMIPNVADFIFTEMMDLIRRALTYMKS